MAKSFIDRAVIVTGASSGLGRAIAVELGRAGAELWLVGRVAAELDTTAKLISDAGGPTAHAAPMDLRQRGPLEALIRQVANSHPHLFAIINNAGIMHPEPILSGTIDRWQAMLDVNIMAILEGSKAAIEAMRKHGKPGHVINIGSIQARFEEPGVYGITKKAAEMIGETLRAEIERDDIRVSTIIPGGFSTQLFRGFTPEAAAQIGSNMEQLGFGPNSPDIAKVLSDPQHIANAVRYILEAPIELNIQEMVIRPPVSIKA